MSLHFFLGVDPAPSEARESDDGGLVTVMARPRPAEGGREQFSENPANWEASIVHALRVGYRDRLSSPQWSGLIHGLHRRFDYDAIGMDPLQGGTFIQRDLIRTDQIVDGVPIKAVPIADRVTGPQLVARGEFILHMLRPGDDGVKKLFSGAARSGTHNDNLYTESKSALESMQILLPRLFGAKGGTQGDYSQWSGEKRMAAEALDDLGEQLVAVEYETNPDGTTKLTSQGSRLWFSRKKKDLVTALMNAIVVFHIWLRMRQIDNRSPEARVASISWMGGGPPAAGMAAAGGEALRQEWAEIGA